MRDDMEDLIVLVKWFALVLGPLVALGLFIGVVVGIIKLLELL